jgi:hypothetical protein
MKKACARLINLQSVYRVFSQEKKYQQARAREPWNQLCESFCRTQ